MNQTASWDISGLSLNPSSGLPEISAGALKPANLGANLGSAVYQLCDPGTLFNLSEPQLSPFESRLATVHLILGYFEVK